MWLAAHPISAPLSSPSPRSCGERGGHVVGQTWAEYSGFSGSQIDDLSNPASIPRLKHDQITGWYGARADEFAGLSPREYLRDKSRKE